VHRDVWFGGGGGLIAQAIGEYGAAGSVSSTVADAFTDVMDRIQHADPKTWVVVAVVAFLIWFLFLRRR
jgi:hypothetical protein